MNLIFINKVAEDVLFNLQKSCSFRKTEGFDQTTANRAMKTSGAWLNAQDAPPGRRDLDSSCLLHLPSLAGYNHAAARRFR